MRRSQILTTFAVAALTILGGCKSTQEILQVGEAGERNPGPCPRAFALYDASRIVEFRDGQESYNSIGFTGEFEKVRSLCRYYSANPIEASMTLDFNFGRGPAAAEQSVATYEYFVAVTRKNIGVINKEVFPLQVTFPPGEDRVSVRDTVNKIVIPRAAEGTSGENFEIIVGFVVNEAQREFNSEGKRFRVSAGQN